MFNPLRRYKGAIPLSRCSDILELSAVKSIARDEFGDLLITNRVTVVTRTKKTEAIPTISARRASGSWVCLGHLGSSSRTEDGQ
jgi:hypothetical protein